MQEKKRPSAVVAAEFLPLLCLVLPFITKVVSRLPSTKFECSNCHLHVGQCLVSIFLVWKTVLYNTFFRGFNQTIKDCYRGNIEGIQSKNLASVP